MNFYQKQWKSALSAEWQKPKEFSTATNGKKPRPTAALRGKEPRDYNRIKELQALINHK